MQVEEIDIDLLVPDQENAREHPEENIEAIKNSIAKFHQVEPLVVQKSTKMVIGGNARLQCLKEMGYKKVFVYQLDLDDKSAKALALALNKTGDLSTWNVDNLKLAVNDLIDTDFNMIDFGFNPDELHDLIDLPDLSDIAAFHDEVEVEVESSEEEEGKDQEETASSEAQEDTEQDTPNSKFKRGEVRSLGNITLANADCLEHLKTLSDNHFDSLVTDPPAGIDFMGKDWDKDKGGSKKWIKWLSEVMTEAHRVMKPGSHGLVWALPRTSYWTGQALEEAGFEIRDKIQHVFGCLSEDSEIYTDTGWKKYNQITAKDRAICYDIESDTFRFGDIQDLYIYDYKDTAYRIYSDSTDQIVSKNHRCIVERNGRKAFRFAETLECQESVPILEDMPSLLKALSSQGQSSSCEKDNMQLGMYKKDKKALSKKESFSNMPSVQERISAKKQCSFKQCEILLKQVSGEMEKSRSRDQKASERDSSFRESWLDREYQGKSQQECEWKKQSSLERWSSQDKQEIEVQGYSSCEVSRRVQGDGQRGWLCNNLQVNGSSTDRKSFTKFRSSSSYKSQSQRQSNRKSDAIQLKQRPQAIRAERFTSSNMVRVEPIDYIGKVWCVKVDTGAFIARRKGKVFVTGNSGFPKSLNVSKAIDKRAGAKREVIGVDKDWLARNPGHKVDGLDRKKEYGGGPYKEGVEAASITVPATEEAKKWDGYGSTLKPAYEDWYLIRKPLEGSIVDNLLKYGTGAIDIDGSRVGGTQGRFPANFILSHTADCELVGSKEVGHGNGLTESDNRTVEKAGYSLHLGKAGIHTPDNSYGKETVEDWICTKSCPVKLLDQQSGILKSGSGKKNTRASKDIYESGHKADDTQYESSSGGASRFFKTFTPDYKAPFIYAAKASKADRNAGLEHFPLKKADIYDDRPSGQTGQRLDGRAERRMQNIHPTVKSQKLMEYLVNLVTPPDGAVLDCFNGSGSTGVAATNLGFKYYGIERELEYCDISWARLEYAKAIQKD